MWSRRARTAGSAHVRGLGCRCSRRQCAAGVPEPSEVTVVRTAPPQLADAVLPGRLAELLADHGEGGLTEALDLLVAELGLSSAVLQDHPVDGGDAPGTTGRLRAISGDAVRVV